MKRQMNRLAALLLATAGGFSTTAAQTISQQAAAERAAQQLNCATSAMMLSHTAIDPLSGEPAYYAFNRQGGGFAIVAADERVEKVVLGYNSYGAYDHASLTDATLDWMNGYIVAVRQARQQPVVSNTRRARRAAAINTSGLPSAVKPLIGTQIGDTEGYLPWHQYAPFNDYCPEKNGQKCAVGCVAMSMAMVMSAHKWPDQGVGSTSYSWNGKTLSTNFAEHSYNWSLMKNRYWTNGVERDYTAAEGHFIATLLRDCGYSAGMIYGSGYEGSGAAEENAAKALYHNFKYDKSVSYLCRDYCTKQYWEDLLRREIAAGRPVMYGGGSRYGAHEFTCDGYDAEGRFFFHMGGTATDGYYATLNVSGGYNTSQTIIYNIMPAGKAGATNQATMVAGSNKDFLWTSGNNITSNVRFFTPIEQFDAQIAVAIENASNSNDVKYVNVQNIRTSNTNNQGTTVTNFQVSENLNNGTYYLYPVYRKQGTSAWTKVLFGQFCQERVTLVVNNGQKTFKNNDLKEDIDEGKVKINNIIYILDNSNKTAAVSYQNSGFNSYSGDVTIPETVKHNNVTYTVTSIDAEAFSECSSVGNITIPATVRSIGYGAFYKCKGKSITFAGNSQLKSIDNYGFAYSGFKSIALPEGVVNLGGEAFVGSEMTDFVLPSSVKSLGASVFSACTSLKNFSCRGMIPANCSISNDPFPNIMQHVFSGMKLYIPFGSRKYYLMNRIWMRFGQMIEGEAPNPDTTDSEKEDDKNVEAIPGTYAIKLVGTNYYFSTDQTQGNRVTTCSLSEKPEYFYVTQVSGGYTITSSRNGKKIGYSIRDWNNFSQMDVCEDQLVWTIDNINGGSTRIRRKNQNYCLGTNNQDYSSAVYTNQQNVYWTLEKVSESKRNAKHINLEQMADETTAIEEVVEQTPAAKQIFDLQGRRVASPIRGRIYVIGGKKVVY